MALKTDIRGMIWRYPDYFVVGREQLRQFAQAVKDRHPAHFDEGAAAERVAVEGVDRGLGVAVFVHLDEAKAT